MTERPDWIKCVRDTAQLRKTWCGRDKHSFEWLFVDADHAAQASRARGRLQVCPECRDALTAALMDTSPVEGTL